MTGSPGIAIRLHGMIDPGRCAGLAAAAERNGFRTVWFAENLFQRGVLPAASASAVATRAIGIGIGVFNPFNRHPSLMAMEIGALDELAGGRAILGLGVGVPPLIDRFAGFGKPLAAMRDTVTIARAMLAGETVTHRGRVFSADGIGLGFKPPRENIPIHIAAMGPRMLRLAGEIGDGVLISNMCPPAFTGHAVALAAEGAQAAGRAPPGAVVKYVPCAVDADGGAARLAVKPAIAAMLCGYEEAFAGAPDALAAIRHGLGDRTGALYPDARPAQGRRGPGGGARRRFRRSIRGRRIGRGLPRPDRSPRRRRGDGDRAHLRRRRPGAGHRPDRRSRRGLTGRHERG